MDTGLKGGDVFIYDAVRTPRGAGKESGGLHQVPPVDLVGKLLDSLVERTGLDPQAVGDVILGCVTQTGDQGGNIARTAILHAGWPDSVSGVAINRFCTSGLDACIMAATRVQCGIDGWTLGGGVESMSRVAMLSDNGPYYADKRVSRTARFVPLGVAADLVASLEGITREEADAYAVRSQQRASTARDSGAFAKSLIAITNPETGNTVTADEIIRPNVTVERLAAFEPAFATIGAKGFDEALIQRFPDLNEIRHIHHAGNSPGMVDGAALVLIGTREAGSGLGLRPRARIRAMANASVDPVIMLTGGIEASRKALDQAGMTAGDIDLVEFNEAFAAVVLKFIRDLDLDPEKVNVNGGAISLGHAMGATGAMQIGMALDELERRDQTTALIALSGGAGVGAAMIIERV
ncbi:MAG: acetyl-CoA C-acetyltransferase [Alphaproteobacteria bacterium]|nr:MAG: acetyl-CoA C-acetyltransferase [Alphaproteobacteria bacterium]